MQADDFDDDDEGSKQQHDVSRFLSDSEPPESDREDNADEDCDLDGDDAVPRPARAVAASTALKRERLMQLLARKRQLDAELGIDDGQSGAADKALKRTTVLRSDDESDNDNGADLAAAGRFEDGPSMHRGAVVKKKRRTKTKAPSKKRAAADVAEGVDGESSKKKKKKKKKRRKERPSELTHSPSAKPTNFRPDEPIAVPEGMDEDDAAAYISKAREEQMNSQFVALFGAISDSDDAAQKKKSDNDGSSSSDDDSGSDSNEEAKSDKPEKKENAPKPRKASKQAIFDMKRESERLIRMNQMELPVRQGNLSIHSFLAGFGIQRLDSSQKTTDVVTVDEERDDAGDDGATQPCAPEESESIDPNPIADAAPAAEAPPTEPPPEAPSSVKSKPPTMPTKAEPKIDRFVSHREAALIRKDNRQAIRRLMASKPRRDAPSDDDDDDDIEIVDVVEDPHHDSGATVSKADWARRLKALAEEQVREKREREAREEKEAEEARKLRKKNKESGDDADGGAVDDKMDEDSSAVEIDVGEFVDEFSPEDDSEGKWMQVVLDSDDERAKSDASGEEDEALDSDGGNDDLVLSDEDEDNQDAGEGSPAEDNGIPTLDQSVTPIYPGSAGGGGKRDRDDAEVGSESKRPRHIALDEEGFAIPAVPIEEETTGLSQDINDILFSNSQPQEFALAMPSQSRIPQPARPTAAQLAPQKKKKIGILEKMFLKAAERANKGASEPKPPAPPPVTDVAEDNEELLGMLSGAFPSADPPPQDSESPGKEVENDGEGDDGDDADDDQEPEASYVRVVESDSDDDNGTPVDEGGDDFPSGHDDQMTLPMDEDEDVEDAASAEPSLNTQKESAFASMMANAAAATTTTTTTTSIQQPKSRFVETEAQEEEDEFMGMGGRDGEDPEDDAPLVCSGDEDEIEDFKDVIELHRKHLIDDDTKIIDSLINDVTTGAMRKRAARKSNRGGFFTLSDSEDDEELLRKIKKGGYRNAIDEDDPNLAPIDRLASKSATAAFARCFTSFSCVEEGESLISDDEGVDENGGVHTVRSVLSKHPAGLSLRRHGSVTVSSLSVLVDRRVSKDGDEGDDEVDIVDDDDEEDGAPKRTKRRASLEETESQESFFKISTGMTGGDDDREDELLGSFGDMDVMKLIKARPAGVVVQQRNKNEVQSIKYTSRAANKVANRTFRVPTHSTVAPSSKSPKTLRRLKALAVSAGNVGGLNEATGVSASRFAGGGKGMGFIVGEAAKARWSASVNGKVGSGDTLTEKPRVKKVAEGTLLRVLSNSSSFS